MAKVNIAGSDTVYKLKKFLGLNERSAQSGDIKLGEAAVMSNFRCDESGALKKRPGMRNVTALYTNFDIGERTEDDRAVRQLWSGYLAGQKVVLAACSGHIWQLTGSKESWHKQDLGTIPMEKGINMYAFDDKVYIQNGIDLYCWDGEHFDAVEGYRPLIAVSVTPVGDNEFLERVNRLTGARRCRLSPDGESGTFKLPESGIQSVDYVIDLATDTPLGHTCDLAAGTVTFEQVPPKGVNTIEVGWTFPENDRAAVGRMRFSELYNGAADSRVFLYGDGSGRTVYSDLDDQGRARGDYFPDLNDMAIGELSAPVTGLIRHYGALLAFKPDGAYSIKYGDITLPDGTSTGGFYITPVNRSIGNCAPGGVTLAENMPRTLDCGGVMEWRASSGGSFTFDERNAEYISAPVENTLKGLDLSRCKCFFDKLRHEYWLIDENGNAVIQNTQTGGWYKYTGLLITCLVRADDELYGGTTEGYLVRISEEYPDDNGSAVLCYWQSGDMAFDRSYREKYSAMLWLTLKSEAGSYLKVSALSDRGESQFKEVFGGSAPSGTGVHRVRLRVRKFHHMALRLETDQPGSPVTVLSAEIRVRPAGYVVDK